MSHEKKDSALQKMQLILLSAAIMIVLAQLNTTLSSMDLKYLWRLSVCRCLPSCLSIFRFSRLRSLQHRVFYWCGVLWSGCIAAR